MIGNEPECVHQGNRAPDEYAGIYHTCYTFIKALDPTASVAIGGVVEPTPLRLEWLDRVMAVYLARYGTKMPVDVWNIHNQVLSEERGKHGCDIPTGLSASVGRIYPWWENDKLEYFADHIVAMRQWMYERGERAKPLIVSEYGILYPSHWFDSLGGKGGDARVNDFMDATFDYMYTTSDATIGMPGDDGRLVQRWMWFSLNSPSYSQNPAEGFNGSLCDYYTHEITTFGLHFADLVAQYLAVFPYTDPTMKPTWAATPSSRH